MQESGVEVQCRYGLVTSAQGLVNVSESSGVVVVVVVVVECDG